jgi:phosphoribosylaminoimidazole (AIR) synthetase
MQITAHFNLAEFTRSESAKRHGVSNQPTAEHLENIKMLCEKVLEPIRMKFGPINISSGYRSKVLNHYIGGSLRSQHCEGRACDIDMDGMGGVTNKQIFEYIKSELEFDQLINEFNYGWIHVSYNAGQNRRQVLDALKVNNKTVYSNHKN